MARFNAAIAGACGIACMLLATVAPAQRNRL